VDTYSVFGPKIEIEASVLSTSTLAIEVTPEGQSGELTESAGEVEQNETVNTKVSRTKLFIMESEQVVLVNQQVNKYYTKKSF
jgi:hypothetical protein